MQSEPPQPPEDELLQRLVLEAKQYPSQSNQHRLVLNRLLSRILKSQHLGHPQRGMWPPRLYEDLRNEAISRTLLEITQKINNYRPEYAVMAWVNGILNFRFRDVVQDYYRSGLASTGQDTPQVRSLDELEGLELAAEAADSDGETLRQFIIADPEHRLMNHLKGRPPATFQWILLQRLENRTWEEISRELGEPPISIQTLCSFFNRQLRNLQHYFQNHL